MNQVRKTNVEDRQANMSFRLPNKKWPDVDVDKATFDKDMVPIEEGAVDWDGEKRCFGLLGVAVFVARKDDGVLSARPSGPP